jgi:anti-sigma B factor antagonist
MTIRREMLTSGIACVHLAGRLDISGVNEVSLKFTAYTVTQRKPVIIDLTEVTFITSMGIGMLISAAKGLRPHKAFLILLNPQTSVEQVIKLAGIDQILPIDHDLDSAIRRITGSA